VSGVLFRETAFSVTCRLSTGPKEVESLSEFREDSGRLGNTRRLIAISLITVV
jgi:hypothetical protein